MESCLAQDAHGRRRQAGADTAQGGGVGRPSDGGLSSYVLLLQMAHLYHQAGQAKSGTRWRNGTVTTPPSHQRLYQPGSISLLQAQPVDAAAAACALHRPSNLCCKRTYSRKLAFSATPSSRCRRCWHC